MRILHLSDAHLSAPRMLHYGTVDTDQALLATLEAAESLVGIDIVVLTGDISDDGSVDSYRRAHELVSDWGARHDAIPVFLMGNHDLPESFETVLGARRGLLQTPVGALIRLDSSVPSQGHGEIGPDQLLWMSETLAKATGPVVVALHHPPIGAVTPLLRALELRRADEMLDLCARAGVAAILCGHYHHAMAAIRHGVAVFVAPGIANITEVTAPAGHERARRGSGFAVVEVDDNGDATAAFVSVRHPTMDGDLIFDLLPADVARIAANERA